MVSAWCDVVYTMFPGNSDAALTKPGNAVYFYTLSDVHWTNHTCDSDHDITTIFMLRDVTVVARQNKVYCVPSVMPVGCST